MNPREKQGWQGWQSQYKWAWWGFDSICAVRIAKQTFYWRGASDNMAYPMLTRCNHKLSPKPPKNPPESLPLVPGEKLYLFFI
jgi:hypothetical protein